MTLAPSFCGIILAAGASSRMGRDKALLPWPAGAPERGNTFLEHHIRALRATTDLVIIVAGSNAPSLEPLAYAQGASIVVNPQPERGQFSSLRIGLGHVLAQGRDAAVVALVDRPAARVASIESLQAAVGAEAWIAIPEYAGRHGHPVVLRREGIELLLRAPDTSNAREVLHAHRERIAYVAVDDPATAMNLNTLEEYERACASAE